MPALDSSLVARHEQWYANRPDYVAHMMERAQRYLHYIVEEVEKRGMPAEIALLPMIESDLNPRSIFGEPCLRYLAVHPVHRQKIWHEAKLVVRRSS